MVLKNPKFQFLLNKIPARTHQATSFGRDPERGGTWWGFRPREALIKRIMLAPGETHVMASVSGPGVFTRLFMTTLLPYNIHALRNLILRFYWDGEDRPSVESPFGDFFGAPFGRYKSYVSELTSLTAGAFNCLFPMPFSSGARLEITNEGPKAVEPFFYNLTYYELDELPESKLRFHALWRRENPTRDGISYRILEAKGEGHYIGCHLSMQNLEWWLRPPLRDIPFPSGFGLGMMEGWETICVDGEEDPSVHGTGIEDYFNGAWYYKDGEFSAPYHGCILRDYLKGRISVYRFDILSPVPFGKSIIVDIDHGFYNRLKSDFSSVAYWYQKEPHFPFPSLPGVERRKPEPPWVNLSQAALIASLPAVASLALLKGFLKKRKR